jgi:hypothetical protein
MTNRKSNFFRMLATVMATMAGSSMAQAYTLQPQQMGNITYVTGGVGDEERAALDAVKNNYNLAIESAGKSGAFVGYTHVMISDTNGQQVLDANAGPLFYAQLPPGKYVVEGDSEGQTATKSITVAENKPAKILFTWK